MLYPGRKRRVWALATAIALGGAALPSVAHAQWFWDSGLSADDAARAVMARGFRVLSRPTRNDDVYVADVIDRRGQRERLIIAADSGRILQRIVMDEPRDSFRRYADPSLQPGPIPPGPIPPGRIPNESRQPSVLSRLFGNDETGTAAPPPPAVESRPFVEPERPVRRPRRPRIVEQNPEPVRQTPVESAPLAPPSAPTPIVPRAVAPPPAVHRAPAQASLPPASETPAVTRPVPAPVVPTPAPSDKPGRSISTNPLAIPGSREQDEKEAPRPSTAEAVKAPKPATPAVKPAVPVAPLE